MSHTFRALERNPNFRLYFAGSVVSNTGTWMQRVAQDWLVLSLPGTGGSELGITTGLQFLPILLLSPYAGVIADRFPKRSAAPADPAEHGAQLPGAGCARGVGPRRGVDGLRAGVRVRHRHGLRRTRASELHLRDGGPRRHQQRGRAQRRRLQPRPAHRAGLRGPPDRAARQRGPSGGLGDPAQRGLVLRGDLAAPPDGRVAPAPVRHPAAHTGHAARRRALRALAAHDADGARAGVLRRDVRDELPDHLGTDGDPGLRQGRRASSASSARPSRSARSPVPCWRPDDPRSGCGSCCSPPPASASPRSWPGCCRRTSRSRCSRR